MEDNKKVEIFDKCFDKEMRDYLDQLTDEQLATLCGNVSSLVNSSKVLLKRQIKKMSKK